MYIECSWPHCAHDGVGRKKHGKPDSEEIAINPDDLQQDDGADSSDEDSSQPAKPAASSSSKAKPAKPAAKPRAKPKAGAQKKK